MAVSGEQELAEAAEGPGGPLPGGSVQRGGRPCPLAAAAAAGLHEVRGVAAAPIWTGEGDALARGNEVPELAGEAKAAAAQAGRRQRAGGIEDKRSIGGHGAHGAMALIWVRDSVTAIWIKVVGRIPRRAATLSRAAAMCGARVTVMRLGWAPVFLDFMRTE